MKRASIYGLLLPALLLGVQPLSLVCCGTEVPAGMPMDCCAVEGGADCGAQPGLSCAPAMEQPEGAASQTPPAIGTVHANPVPLGTNLAAGTDAGAARVATHRASGRSLLSLHSTLQI